MRTSSSASSEEQDEPTPPLRAKGSFHPRGASSSSAPAAPPSLTAPPTEEDSGRVTAGSRARALCVLSLLLTCALGVIGLVAVLCVLDRPDLWVHVLPNGCSVAGSLWICCCWLALPELRTTHGGHVFWLSIAQAGYSAAAIAAAASERCDAQQVAALAWVCTWGWATPVALDWLLLLWHQRGAGARRAALARWCHLVWPCAACLTLPTWLGPQARVAPAAASPAQLAAYCVPAAPRASARAFALVAVPFALATALHVAAYAAGMRRSAADAPLIVCVRQRRRAALFVAAACALHPPQLLVALYTHCLRTPPPAPLAWWAALAGAPLQGLANALLHLLCEPSVAARLLGALPPPARDGCGACAAACCAVCCCAARDGSGGGGGGWLVSERLLHADSRVLLLHADSRHAHFAPDAAAAAPVRGGAEARAREAVLRVLEEEEARARGAFRWWRGVLPLALVVAVLLVLFLAGGGH